MKPGTLVKFTLNSLPVIGHIVSNGKSTAQVRVNGGTYEVAASQLQVIPACRYCGGPLGDRTIYCCMHCRSADAYHKHKCAICGKPTSHSKNKHCSNECMTISRHREMDRVVFAGLVEYKRLHDGSTPKEKTLAKQIFSNELAVEESLHRLAAAGKIRFEGKGSHRSIIIPGAKWTYEESSP